MELTWDLRFVDEGEGRSRYDSTKSTNLLLKKNPWVFDVFNPLKKPCVFFSLAAPRDGLGRFRRRVGFPRLLPGEDFIEGCILLP